jgi:hypothetical protein
MPAPVFVAGRLPACGSPAGASKARRSVHSKKPLYKRTHPAAMRSISRQLFIASLREEKCKNRFKREKTPRRGVFLILNRKPLPCYLKRIAGQFERSFFKKVLDFIVENTRYTIIHSYVYEPKLYNSIR